jgi:hypothetical protein
MLVEVKQEIISRKVHRMYLMLYLSLMVITKEKWVFFLDLTKNHHLYKLELELELELELKKPGIKKQLLVIEIQLEKVRGGERSSRTSSLSRNETVVEKNFRIEKKIKMMKNISMTTETSIVKINLKISQKTKIVEMVVWDLKSS